MQITPYLLITEAKLLPEILGAKFSKILYICIGNKYILGTQDKDKYKTKEELINELI
jgi:hypothetical protein